MNAQEREALRLAVDKARRERIPKPHPGLIDFPVGSTARHGTVNGYRLGCKCESCRHAATAVRTAWRKKNHERDLEIRRRARQRKKAREREQARQESEAA